MRRLSATLALAAAILAPGLGAAQAAFPPGLSARHWIAPATVVAGDEVVYTLVVEETVPGAADKLVQETSLPPFANVESLRVTRTASRTSSIRAEGAGTIRTTTHTCRIVADEPGESRIPAARLRVGEEWFETDQLLLRVNPVLVVDGAGALVVPFTSPSGDVTAHLRKRLFIQIVLPAAPQVEKESLILMYMYRDPEAGELLDWKTSDYLWGNDIKFPNMSQTRGIDTSLEWETVMLDGTRYLRAPILRATMIPLRSGQLTLFVPEVNVSFTVPVKTPEQRRLLKATAEMPNLSIDVPDSAVAASPPEPAP